MLQQKYNRYIRFGICRLPYKERLSLAVGCFSFWYWNLGSWAGAVKLWNSEMPNLFPFRRFLLIFFSLWSIVFVLWSNWLLTPYNTGPYGNICTIIYNSQSLRRPSLLLLLLRLLSSYCCCCRQPIRILCALWRMEKEPKRAFHPQTRWNC